MDGRGTSGEITMITYTVREETTRQDRIEFCVYRDADNVFMSAYATDADAEANVQARSLKDEDRTGNYERQVDIYGWIITLAGNYLGKTHFFQTTWGFLGPYESAYEAEIAAIKYWSSRWFGLPHD